MYKAVVDNTSMKVSIKDGKMVIDGHPISWDCVKMTNNTFHALYRHSGYRIRVLKADYSRKIFLININGYLYKIKMYNRSDLLVDKIGMDVQVSDKTNVVKAPMPGLILDIKVAPGDQVKTGDTLLVLEAMKMENTLKATYDGTVKGIQVKQGDNVDKGQVLVEF